MTGTGIGIGISIAAFMEGGGFAALVAGSSPAAWWRMSSTTDASGNGRTLTLVAAPSQAATGGLRGDGDASTEFNGTTQYATAADVAALDFAGSFTVAAMIRSTDPLQAFKEIVSKSDGNSADDNYELRFNNTSGTIQGAAVIGGVITTAMGATVLSALTWYDIAMTYDGTNLRVYVNGVQDGITPVTGVVATNTYPVVIGARRATSTPQLFFNGRIDEVRLYTRALTAAELLAQAAFL